jgi:hypothetical protein
MHFFRLQTSATFSLEAALAGEGQTQDRIVNA